MRERTDDGMTRDVGTEELLAGMFAMDEALMAQIAPHVRYGVVLDDGTELVISDLTDYGGGYAVAMRTPPESGGRAGRRYRIYGLSVSWAESMAQLHHLAGARWLRRAAGILRGRDRRLATEVRTR